MGQLGHGVEPGGMWAVGATQRSTERLDRLRLCRPVLRSLALRVTNWPPPRSTTNAASLPFALLTREELCVWKHSQPPQPPKYYRSV